MGGGYYFEMPGSLDNGTILILGYWLRDESKLLK